MCFVTKGVSISDPSANHLHEHFSNKPSFDDTDNVHDATFNFAESPLLINEINEATSELQANMSLDFNNLSMFFL
jgi:hypothetical protein